MKVAIPSLGPNLESPISPHFSRAPFFLIIEVKDGEIKNFEVMTNDFTSAPRGLALMIANIFKSKGIEAVVCSNIGKGPYEALKNAGIKIYSGVGTVKELAIKAEKGELQEM